MDTLSAFHESGHATISLLLGEFPEESSIRPEGDSLGHTRYLGVEARAIAEAAVRGSTAADRDSVMAYHQHGRWPSRSGDEDAPG